MIKLAYIVTKQHTGEFLEDSVLLPLSRGEQIGEVVAIYFVEDGVYHLVKGARSSKNIKIAQANGKLKIIACKASIKNRNLQNILIDGVEQGDIKDFFAYAIEADHIISF